MVPRNFSRRRRRWIRVLASGFLSLGLLVSLGRRGGGKRRAHPEREAKLETKEAALNKKIRHDRKTGGGLSRRERRKIDRQQDRLSRDIYREKHDADKAPPTK